MTEPVLYAVQATGQAEAAGAFGVVQKAIAKSGSELELYSKRTQKAASLVTALSGAVSGIAPQFAALGVGAGRAAPAIEALTGLIGGGVGAAIGGGLVAALGLATAAWKIFGEEQDVARATIEQTSHSLEEQIALIEEYDRAKNLRDVVAEGLGGPEAQFAEVRRLEEERGGLTYERAEAARSGVVTRRLRALDQELRRNRAELDKARDLYRQSLQEETDFAVSGEADESTKKSGEPKLTENEKRIQALRKLEEQNYAEGSARMRELDQAALVLREAQRKASLDREVDQARIAAQTKLTLEKQAVEEQLRMEHAAYDERKFLSEQAYEREAELAEQRRKVVGDQGKQAYDMLSGAASNMFGRLVAGQKVSTREFLKGLGVQAAQQGLFNFLQAVWESANPITAAIGAARIPPALAMMAIGGGTAAVAGAAGGGGGGGGGRGGGGNVGNWRGTPLLAEPSTDTGGRQRPMVVEQHIHLSSTITPTSRDAQAMREAEAEARRHGL